MTEKNNTRKPVCSLICTFLVLCICFACVSQTIANAADNKIYVADIKIYECEDEDNAENEAKAWFASNGYVYSGINLNQGTDTDWNAYLGYKTTMNKDAAITDIRMMAMDTGYTIYNYEDMANYLASQKAGTAQTLQSAAVAFAANYRAGSPKAKDAYEGLNLFHVGDAEKTKLGDYILAGKTDVQFFTKMIMKSTTGTLNAVHGFLANGIAPYNNDLDENGAVVTTNWAQFTVRSEFWDTLENGSLSTDEMNELHKNYNDAARELFRTIQDFTTYYENASARAAEKNALPEADTMKEAADAMEEVEREDSDFLYLAAFSMLNEYAFSDGTHLGDWFIGLGRTNSDSIDLVRLYPVVEAMGKCQAAIASSGGFVSAVINLSENVHNENLNGALDTAKETIRSLTNETAFNIWENADGDIENSTIAFTSDAVRKSTAENALGRKSNWEKKKETIAEIEKIVNLAMGALCVVVPVMTFVASMAVVVTHMMAATCIAVAALNTMCVWLLAAAQILSAVLPYVGILVMVATITATVTILIKEYIMGDKVHIDKQSEKPEVIFDAQEKAKETFDIKYKSVRNQSGAVSDINCGSQIYWCLAATTTDVNAGSPIVADAGGVIFRSVSGNEPAPSGFDCVKFFGERSAGDFNAYCKKNTVNGVYVYYRTEASIAEENAPRQNNQPTGQEQTGEMNYIADLIVCTGKSAAAAAGCADEVIVVNLAMDNQSDAWYNRQKDGIALTEAAVNKSAAYIGVTRTDVGTVSRDGTNSKQRPITGVLLYCLDDTTAPGVIEVDNIQYTCAAVSTPIVMKGVKYFLYYSYSAGAFPGKPIEEIVIDNIPIIDGHATNLCADPGSNEPYGNAEQTSFIHLKYEQDKNNDFFNKIYIGQGSTEREAKCDLLSHGCLEYLKMNANFGVKKHSVYIGYRRGHIDMETVNSQETESLKASELQDQLQEAIYDIIITDDEPYHADGIVRNNIYYVPVGQVDLTGGMGHRLYMYYASPWYSARYNKNTGSDTLLPQNVFSGYLTHLALAQYDRVPYNSSLATTTNTEESKKPWEYVMLADHSRPVDLNEGTIAFKVDSDTARYAYDNRITMFIQRSDGSVKPAAEITGGFTARNMIVGSGYINTSGTANVSGGATGGWGSNFTGGTIALIGIPVLALGVIVFALVYKKKKRNTVLTNKKTEE